MERQCHQKACARVSVLLHPLALGDSPLLWRDWSRREHRRASIQLLRSQRIDVQIGPAALAPEAEQPVILSGAQRAHYGLGWEARLARNACAPTARAPTIKLYGVPDDFAAFLSLPTE